MIYGISNCDTIKKTLDWFKKRSIAVGFHDYKKSGITQSKLKEWIAKKNWDILLNKKSTTWRSLSTEEQEKITTEKNAIRCMLENTSIIKRPVIEYKGELLVGFDEKLYTQKFKN